ncbi:autophagy protein Apg5-domain-containing protein [Irpex rosettiformis]|uniref:Autophagy protein Apg5-domain-containing protein n=1 Tax=Irpex rosettiformis TaxID=378272 RepID=A0ACB8UGN9_9APHY|nr:autophagy protein Apg5-domain-containing protein [Irpex rosettiformis]
MSTYARPSPSAFTTSASTTLFRRLTWEGTVPLEIRVDSKELPANSDRGLECYYVQAPRVSYLPLLIPDLKRFLLDVVFDEAAARTVKEEDWWFESDDGNLLKWHWPIGLLYDNYTIAASSRNPTASSSQTIVPLRLVLHLAAPPTDKLLLSPSAETCKQAFMGQMKEADFIRWGNTKRMTSLRKAEQDGLWEGIKEHNFDEYWRVASKVTPTTTPTRPTSPAPGGATSLHSRPPSVDPNTGAAPDRDGAYSVRSVPVRIYLPDGPVLQDLVPPVLEDGSPNTLANILSTQVPLLFPASASDPPFQDLAHPLIQGILAPKETDVAWLGACMAGADGWVNVCVSLLQPR